MKLPVSVTRAFGKLVITTQKNQPHILFGVGVVGVVGSTILACRATLSLEETIDDIKISHEKTTSMKSSTTQQEYGRELIRTYAESAMKLGKLYGPSIVLGGLSIAALTKSHAELSRRNAALTAAYTGLQQMFEEYRGRVREAIGEERENEIYMNAREITVVDEDGKKKKILSPNGLPNQYARVFDKNCRNWKPSPEYNRYFLMEQQNYANDRLHAIGHVTLNDVYDWLGYDRVPAGQLIGWTVNSDQGDGYISFGLDNAFNVRGENNMLDGLSYILDFNVEGTMYDKI